MPIFSFYPGASGVIGIPGNTNDLVYWNKKSQPAYSAVVPMKDDKLFGKSYINMFSFSIDLFVREIENTNSNARIILYKASAPIPSPKIDKGFTEDSFINYMKTRSSMIMYLTNTNDLMITFFSDSMQYNIAPIKNIPLYTPFRITVVVEDKMFTVYLNGKQIFQRLVTNLITTPKGLSGTQSFYASPDWANTPKRTIFVQNFHLWGRVITYKEILAAKPALALSTKFDLTPEAPACVTDSQAIAAGAQNVVSTVQSILGTP